MTERAKRRVGLAVIVSGLLISAGFMADLQMPWSAASAGAVVFLLLTFAPFLTEDK